MRRPQLSVLPTMSFWLRADVRAYCLPAYLVGLAAAMLTAVALGLSPLAAGIVGATLPLLTIGGLERLVRRAALRRRRLAPSWPPPRS
jgi:hypothetical protein